MLSINAMNYYASIKNKLSELEDIIKFIQENDPIQEKQNIIISILKGSPSSNSNYYTYSVEKPANSTSEGICSSYNKKFSTFKKEFNVLTFFSKLATVRSELQSMFKEYNHEESNVISMLNNLNELANLYQNIIQNNDDKKDIVFFFDAAEKYIAEYWSVVNGIHGFVNALTNEVIEYKQPNTKVLELQLLDVRYDVGQFAEILQHLDVAYSTFARLVLDINITQLQIVKIESGSLLSLILGNENIIEVMGYTLKKIVDWVYHTYTKEGKIDLNSKLMQEISTNADIIEKLNQMGVKTDKSKENLSDTLNVVTKELYDIAVKAPRIKINDEEMKVNDTQKYLEYTTKYLIETTDTNNNNADNNKTELPQE